LRGKESGIAELESLVHLAKVGKAAGGQDLDHMDRPAAAFNYIRMANLVTSLLGAENITMPVLDWGCGYGQVSWLLQQRGVDVVSYDLERRPARESIPPLNSVKVNYGCDPVALPYESGLLSAVLSVGVLEHVPDIDGSLKEINRVLKPQGCFFLLMFPNLYSWAEWIADRRGISVHPRKFTVRETSSLLRSHGFHVETKWRRNFLPRNLTGFPVRAKAAYGRFYRQIEAIDRIPANIPPTSYFSGVLEFVARKHE
jgi:SAM-dependent methyltransferase